MRSWQINLSKRIDAERSTPLYMQIIQAVIRDIENGRLTSGAYLPSSRELARILGVSRKTVVLAYDDLIAQGWLATSGTRGTMVSSILPESCGEPTGPETAKNRDVRISYSFAVPPNRPLALSSGDGLKIDEGTPDGRLFPPELLVRAFRSTTLAASRSDRLQYRDPRGTPELREAIANMLSAQRGLVVEKDNICITRGGQNGIFLAGMSLLRSGDAVIVEALTYEPAVAARTASAPNATIRPRAKPTASMIGVLGMPVQMRAFIRAVSSVAEKCAHPGATKAADAAPARNHRRSIFIAGSILFELNTTRRRAAARLKRKKREAI